VRKVYYLTRDGLRPCCPLVVHFGMQQEEGEKVPLECAMLKWKHHTHDYHEPTLEINQGGFALIELCSEVMAALIGWGEGRYLKSPDFIGILEKLGFQRLG
jgi:hypothetical protein